MSFFIAGVLALVLILVGCGSDTTPSQSPDPDNSTHRGPNPVDPLLQPAIHTTRLDQSITFNIQNSDPLSDRILRQPQQGTVILNADGSVTYSPVPGAMGEDSFEIEINEVPREITVDNNLAYEGQIDGEENSFGNVEVLLTGEGVLETASPDPSGRFKFYALPDGDYVVKVRKAGYTSSLARAFSLDIRQHKAPGYQAT